MSKLLLKIMKLQGEVRYYKREYNELREMYHLMSQEASVVYGDNLILKKRQCAKAENCQEFERKVA